MHDGIELELNGTPTAVIITEEFEIPARTIARIRGIPDYPYARVPHPIGSLDMTTLCWTEPSRPCLKFSIFSPVTQVKEMDGRNSGQFFSLSLE